MKRICIVGLAIFLLASSGPDAFAAAITDPTTNALSGDLRIEPRFIEPMAYFGSHVAQRSNVLVIAYQTTEYSPTNSPLADVYHRSATGLVFQGSIPRLVTPMTVHDLATDGQRIAVAGSEGVLPRVYFYRQVQGAWTHEGSLHPSGPVWRISVSGDVIICGSSLQALVFERQGSEWREFSLSAPANVPSSVKNGFGADVAVDRETILIGARGEIRSDAGRAYVFVRESEQWRLQAELLPEPYIYTPFGGVVALDGDTALVSAYATRFNGGFVYVFKRSGGAWTRTGTLNSPQQQDFFGSSLAISGRNLIVGAPSAFGGAGALHIFRENGASIDQFLIRYDDFESSPYPPFPSLGGSISADGNTILAGADGYSGFAENGGLAAMFTLRFGDALISPFVRPDDQSFHFRLIEAEPGLTYVLETKTTLDSEWSAVTEFFPDQTEMQLQVDFNPASPAAFFRTRLRETYGSDAHGLGVPDKRSLVPSANPLH